MNNNSIDTHTHTHSNDDVVVLVWLAIARGLDTTQSTNNKVANVRIHQNWL